MYAETHRGTSVGKTDVVIIGSTKERGGMHSAVEMEIKEMVQKGRKNFDTVLKSAFQISLTSIER